MSNFTDEDVANLRSFLQFIADHARFEVDWAEAIQLTKYRQFGDQLLRKVNAHVLELRSIREAESDGEAAGEGGQ